MPDSSVPFTSLPEARRLVGDEPTLVVVSGGRQGVGATSLTLGLAAALAQEALRVVVIDANRQQASLAAAAGLKPLAGIDEVLSGRKTIHEALTRGTAGLQILAGSVSPVGFSLSQRAIDRLEKQIHSLARHCDLLLVDAGSQPSDLTARLWQLAHTVLLVTSPEAAAVMDAYALIKRLYSAQQRQKSPTLVVTQAATTHQAADVHRRIDQSTRRFLGLPVELGGRVPLAAGNRTAASPPAELARAYSELAKQLVSGARPAVQPLAA